ncbi:hypothetical protein LWI29_033909 [Acer saccharum]|uniref:RNase H type-1 domain-containing protein n=1 Tax=Acer saccharum TaxID=4024 RepID=A0AA39SWA1_ACESA|nr:hypothetical protein LWI29_033909 [Acer saccharum]
MVGRPMEIDDILPPGCVVGDKSPTKGVSLGGGASSNGLVVHQANFRCDESIVGWSYDFLSSFRAANFVKEGVARVVPAAVPNWCPQCEGLFKVNVDAAVKNGHIRCGIWVVVAEATAILYGIRFAAFAGFLPAVIDSDAKSVMDIINSGVVPRTEIGLVIQDILSLLSCFPISVFFISRKANMVAHCLTHVAFSSGSSLACMGSLPPNVEFAARADCPI